MPNKRRVAGVAISSGWILVMVVPIIATALWLAIDHANANQARAVRHSNALTEKKFRQALAVSDRKFQQALALQNALFSYSTNKSVCGFRGFVKPTLARAVERRKTYPSLTPTARALNENAIKTTQSFLDSQVTVPANFKCAALPKKPPKAEDTQ